MANEQDNINGEDKDKKESETEDENKPAFSDGQLSYVGRDVEEIPKKFAEVYGSITRRLDLSYNSLQNVEGLSEFSHLEELILDNNMLGDDIKFPKLKKLHTLTLNKNNITNLENLLDNLMSNLPSLTYLSLLSNVACPNQLSCLDKDEEDYMRYRYYVLYRLPKLKFLDSTPVKPDELKEAKRVGLFMRVVKVDDTEQKDVPAEKEATNDKGTKYSPLPDSSHSAEKPIASFGKSKYVYYGKHSEGNRFIRNSDL